MYGGLSTCMAQSIIRRLVCLNLVRADLVEISPSFHHAEIISLAAASLLRDMICVHKVNLGR
ncbi:MAG: hypothetical protein HN551_06170 [Tateyamaria sp.]|nr:hypothetical protein [Tateyamaria sp.]MBT7800819.1 hypothetical protein [Tateyamaria sp.]